jgi:hypothetical protein
MRIFTIFALLALVGCHPSTEPLPSGDGPAVTPADGSQYQYIYTGSDTSGHTLTLNEVVTVSSSGSDIIAIRTSDTVRHFSTTGRNSYSVRTDGDLQCNGCTCDWFRFPIQTHQHLSGSVTTPCKHNGIYFDGLVTTDFYYRGAENITVGTETFLCSKIERKTNIRAQPAVKGISPVDQLSIFWYSSKLGYFVKEQCTTDGHPSGNYTRILVSHR